MRERIAISAYGDAVVSFQGNASADSIYSFKSALTHFQYDTFVGDLSGAWRMRAAMFSLDEEGMWRN